MLRQRLIWLAKYDEGFLSEFDLKDQSIENGFVDIEKDRVNSFGLISDKDQFFFDVKTGSFYIFGKRIDIKYKTDNKTVFITDVESKRDIITYKKAFAIFSTSQKEETSGITEFIFGYKSKLSFDNIEMHVKILIHIENKDVLSPSIEVSVTSSEDIDGYLEFYTNKTKVAEFEAPLKKNQNGSITIDVKI